MSEIVILDTMICLWGFKGKASTGQEHKIKDAQAFLMSLEEEGYHVGISTVTLSELLVLCKESERQELAKAIEDTVTVYSFDTSAAIHAADIFRTWKEEKLLLTKDRQTIKADCQIIGTAIAQGASILYSDDAEIKKIAGDRLIVLPLPSVPQPELDHYL